MMKPDPLAVYKLIAIYAVVGVLLGLILLKVIP
jgi:hypothetical protein